MNKIRYWWLPGGAIPEKPFKLAIKFGPFGLIAIIGSLIYVLCLYAWAAYTTRHYGKEDK